jgi:hypothetical protein
VDLEVAGSDFSLVQIPRESWAEPPARSDSVAFNDGLEVHKVNVVGVVVVGVETEDKPINLNDA